VPKAALTMTLTGGHFRRGAALQQAITPPLRATVEAGQAALLQSLRGVTPVVSGYLKAQWAARSPVWNGLRYIGTVTNEAPYARRVDKTSKRNRGYIARGLAAGTPSARRLLREGAIQLAPVLWEPHK
jgi:hypothetical protein